MQNTALKEYISTFLDRLGRRADGRPYGYQDLLKPKQFSKSTLYNWLDGAPLPPDGVEKLRLALVAVANSAAVSGATADSEGIKDDLARILAARPQDAWAEFIAVNYPPVSSRPDVDPDKEWSFLGTVAKKFVAFSGRDEREVTWHDCDVRAFEQASDGAILIGLFAMPQRTADWNYIRLPIAIPLNAVVLEHDIQRLIANSNGSNPSSCEEYLSRLRNALWQTYTSKPIELASVIRQLRPITADREAGRLYAIQAHGFREEQLTGDKAESPDAESFLRRLSRLSPELQRQVPICLADELTCLKILRAFVGTELANHTRALLLSAPSSEVGDPRRTFRPQYWVTISVRHDRASKVSGETSFDVTRRMFEEFLRSNAATVAHQYVRLYSELVSRFEPPHIVGECAAIYFLRWLSLEIEEDDIERAGRARPLPRTLADRYFVDSALGAWSDVLHTAKSIILSDAAMRERLLAAFAFCRDRSAAIGPSS